MTSLVTEKGNKEECFSNARVVKVIARNFGLGQWSFIGPGSEKKWYSAEKSPQGAWDHIADEMLLEFAEGGHPTFPATTPLSLGEEFEAHQDGSGEPEILMGQSIVLGEIKAEIPLQNENSLNHQILWQQYMERIESLSSESKVSRF